MNAPLFSQWTVPFANALYHGGVRDVVISPGSRSTPLTLAFLDHPHLRCQVIVDERSAAFFALGQVRLTGRPTALLCTSGSAGAHYFPAIAEAFLTHLPLIAITADRPWELQQCGANQTTAQQQWYGAHVKAFFELGESAGSAPGAAVRIATQAILAATSPAKGPVHINARFRKPLDPDRWPLETTQKTPLPTIAAPGHPLTDEAIAAICAYVDQNRRGLIVCGPGPLGSPPEDRRAAVVQLAQKAGFPVLAETASGIKGSAAPFVQHTTAFFSNAPASILLPSLLLEIHRPLTDSKYERFVRQHPEIPRVVISNDDYVDFTHTAAAVFTGDFGDGLTRVAARLQTTADPHWMPAFTRFDQGVDSLMESQLNALGFCEAHAIQTVLTCLQPPHTLCIGNSLVVRDADLFPAPLHCAAVLHQRGASGIDGLISGAAGTASVTKEGVLLLLGDVSALHDLGGFALLRNATTPVVVVIVHNDGGQIFNELPIAKVPGLGLELDQGFVVSGTPSFRGVCDMFDIPFHRVTDRASLERAVSVGLQQPCATVVEVAISPNHSFRADYFAALAAYAGEGRGE